MSESGDWTEGVAPAPRKRRGLGFWLLSGCGCGCLFIVLALITGGVFLKRSMDPDRHWPRIRELLPYDEQPEELEFVVGWSLFGPEQYQLYHSELDLYGALHRFDSEEELDVLFDPDAPANLYFSDASLGTTRVQGREVRSLSFKNVPDASKIPDWMGSLFEEQEKGAGAGEVGRTVRVDLSGDWGPLALDVGGAQEIGEDEVNAFLEDFDVWRER